jgi:alpha-D-xyloside xylohydrolase
MTKPIYLLIIVFLPIFCSGQPDSNFSQTTDGINIRFQTGTLTIMPLSNDAVRVKFFSVNSKDINELVFDEQNIRPEFKVNNSNDKIRVFLKNLTVVVDKQTGKIDFANAGGIIFLSEKAGSRKLIASTIKNETCYLAEQSFESPSDEYLFGLGQFQDGNFNLKGITRRLTQVNSQIALPFIYSSKGYGLFWHQYGLTDFNPADNEIKLVKQEKTQGSRQMAEVTTTSGTQKIAQDQSVYTGEFTLPNDGEYSVFMDLGGMGNRHFVTIDGQPLFDQTNMWLPPTAGKLIYLKAGQHHVQLICKADNHPKLSWRLNDNTTTFRSPVTTMLDYIVIAGTADEVLASFANLSGHAPMLPKWAYGFWQCRERYSSGKQLVETVKEFRQRNLPMDVIVQDWQYWGNQGWGVPQFDPANYPDPQKFIEDIHRQNAHFNISIWSNPDQNSNLGKSFVERGFFIPNTKWLDYYNPETRNAYWNTLKTNMFDQGVDSWWMDAVEPENDALAGETTFAGPGDFYRLTYPLMVSKAVYEGQRATSGNKRVCILTRSAFPGQQRFGVINWSGDIGGNWDTYKRQIVAGLNYTISGMPYWTTDIGGFFRPGPTQYTDEKYHELLTRWFQWGAFNPIFRVHGYMSETEPWKYGPTVEDNMRKIMNVRYQLLPYIYAQAWQVTQNGAAMMRPLVMDFASDTTAMKQPYEFMFGSAFLVSPVLEPGKKDWNVYLTASNNWYNFWTNEMYSGGQTITTDAPLDKIPLFVKAGSIVPVGPNVQYATQSNNESLEIRIYEGADGEFILYEDEGYNYNYEKGDYTTITFGWNDADKTLRIGYRIGLFQGMITNREFKIHLISKGKNAGAVVGETFDKIVPYSGKETIVKIQ